MPVTLIAGEHDEIADLINMVRSAPDNDVGIVLPMGSTALQTPLNARLLSQFSRQTGRRTAIVSGDPHVQELARANGFAVYASVPAFERGIQILTPPARTAPGGNGGGVAVGATAGAAAAVAAGAAAPPVPPAPSASVPEPPPLGVASEPQWIPPSTPPPTPRRVTRPAPHRGRRRLYIAGAIAGLVGLLLFLLLAPAATITVTLAGQQLSVNPTIQGSTDANQAKAGDHILTAVLQANGTGNFTATPTGQKTIPATAAKGTEVIATTITTGAYVILHQGDTFQTADHAITFLVTQDTHICIGPNGQPPSASCQDPGGQVYPPNNSVPIQDATPEAKGNVPANAITYWPQNPCLTSPYCQSQHVDFKVTNPQPTTGGADPQQQTVASASDVSNWNTQVTQIETTLTNQVNSQLQTQAAGRVFAVDPAGGGKSLTFDVKPALPSADQQFSASQVTVTGTAKAAVYTLKDAQNDMLADLRAQVTQGDQMGPNSFHPQPCQITQADADGTIILSCAATAFSQPIVDLNGLKKQLAGKNPGDANKIIQGRVDKVQDVQVSEFPFRLFYLPFISSRITINENFVSPPASP